MIDLIGHFKAVVGDRVMIELVAGIVDQHIDATGHLPDLPRNRHCLSHRAEVGLQPVDLGIRGRLKDLGSSGIDLVRTAPERDHMKSVLGQSQGGRKADARRCARYYDSFHLTDSHCLAPRSIVTYHDFPEMLLSVEISEGFSRLVEAEHPVDDRM